MAMSDLEQQLIAEKYFVVSKQGTLQGTAKYSVMIEALLTAYPNGIITETMIRNFIAKL